jgi:hypothetical protein
VEDDRHSDRYERAAGGMDYDEPIHERAASIGSKLANGGPEALFEEIENLLPESWRQHITAYPITALAIGVGLGLFLGMKKGEQIVAAGSSMVAAAAAANLNKIMANRQGAVDSEEED